MARPISLRTALSGLVRFVRVFSPHVRSQRAVIGGALAALIGETLLRVLEPWPLKFIIDRIADRGFSRVSLPALEQMEAGTLFALAALALVVFTGLRAVAAYFSAIGFALAGNRALTSIRGALFRHVQALSLSFHNRARGGDLVVRMIGDIGMVQEVAVTAVLPLLGNLLILLCMFAVMLWLDWRLALIAIAVLPVMLIATWQRGRRIHESSRRTRSREGDMAATAAESMAAIRTVQSLSLSGRFADSFSGQNSASLSEGLRTRRLSAGLERGVDVLIAIATAGVLWYGAHRVMDRQLSPGELLVFLLYLKSAFRPMRDIAKYGARLAKAAAASERIVELFETAPDVRDRADAVEAPSLQGTIEFAGISYAYEAGRPALDGVDVRIEAGCHVALVGASGSGKSTLVNLLLRLYDPVSGQVRIDGRDIREFTLASLRAQVSVVPQDTLLFATTVSDNIAYGAEEVSDTEIEAAARLANAHDFIAALPLGYQTQVGERGVMLSAGQRQRIAIARAAIRNSPILILDEPTTGLDSENERLVMQALERLSSGRTTLHITHRLEAARTANLILCLDQGRLLETGSHAQLLARGGRYASLVVAARPPAEMEMQHA
jgi:ATP-binding cassette subfamily B protein